jgi:hypothetical protein
MNTGSLTLKTAADCADDIKFNLTKATQSRQLTPKGNGQSTIAEVWGNSSFDWYLLFLFCEHLNNLLITQKHNCSIWVPP